MTMHFIDLARNGSAVTPQWASFRMDSDLSGQHPAKEAFAAVRRAMEMNKIDRLSLRILKSNGGSNDKNRVLTSKIS